MAIMRRPKTTSSSTPTRACSYGSDDWQRFCREHGLQVSMSRRGNCWDNSVARILLQQPEKGRDARESLPITRCCANVFDYMEVFTDSAVMGSAVGLSPVAFKAAHQLGRCKRLQDRGRTSPAFA
ncbi:MAG: hypothetical protein R3F12_13395 [Lysobacteraceae bacterium]